MYHLLCYGFNKKVHLKLEKYNNSQYIILFIDSFNSSFDQQFVQLHKVKQNCSTTAQCTFKEEINKHGRFSGKLHHQQAEVTSR